MRRPIFQNKNFRSAVLILIGLLLGWMLFHDSEVSNSSPKTGAAPADSTPQKQIWTCAMHPQIRMDHPGKCPICGMDLIPLVKSNADVDQNAVQMSESAIKLAEVQTTIVGQGSASKELRLYGKIQPDERMLVSQSAHVPGRIEQLNVNITGENVNAGQLIARIYSPELITAQKELLEAKTLSDKYPEILQAAREKLRSWKLTDQQIAGIEKSGKVKTVFELYATRSGVVAERKVSSGDYVSQGQVLFDMADLSRLWAIFDAYEADLPWISIGENVEFTLQAMPGKVFNGKISFIEPVVDPVTRVTKVRVELPNSGMKFKPEMFVSGIIRSGQKSSAEQLIVPKSAVLWTGTRSVVYVKVPGAKEPTFKMQEVTLGNSMQDSYEILSGLVNGAEVVTNGAFSVDAAAQLEGKPSMMNSEGGTSDPMPGMVHSTENTNIAHEQNTIDSSKADVNIDFVKQLTAVYEQYIVLKNRLVESDSKKAKESAGNLKNMLSKVNMNLLSGDSHQQWMSNVNAINREVDNLCKSTSIEEQRLAFSKVSNGLYSSIRKFGLTGKTVYYQFCPMALDQKGAYWLSESKEIRNPYFGQAMLNCGETKETMKF